VNELNILWDFDGTLFDTYPSFTFVMHELLNASAYFGLSNEEVIEFKQKEKSLSPRMKKPFPYVEDVLKKADVNVIMTHKPRDEVQTILHYFNWNHYFREIVAGDDGFPRKPNSASYRYLHEKYQLDLAVGDRLLDLLPAKEIGLATCFFQNNEDGADFYVNTYEDFFDVVKINKQ
jgi:HAD superfamily hydrolase (TIGR01549 family)